MLINNKLIRLHNSSIIGEWSCPICNQNFYDKNFDFEEDERIVKERIEQITSVFE